VHEGKKEKGREEERERKCERGKTRKNETDRKSEYTLYSKYVEREQFTGLLSEREMSGSRVLTAAARECEGVGIRGRERTNIEFRFSVYQIHFPVCVCVRVCVCVCMCECVRCVHAFVRARVFACVYVKGSQFGVQQFTLLYKRNHKKIISHDEIHMAALIFM